MDPARRADVMANLREKIWSAGGLVATTPQGEAEATATATAATEVKGADGLLTREEEEQEAGLRSASRNGVGFVSGNDQLKERRGRGGGRGGGSEEAATATTTFEGEPGAMVLPLTRSASDGGRRAALPVAAGASSTATAVRGGGGADVGHSGNDVVGSSSGGGGGGRPGLGTRSQSVSAALTQKEGLIHKVNVGLSGLETNIFFQLMLTNMPPLPPQLDGGRASLRGATPAVPRLGSGAAGLLLPPGPGPGQGPGQDPGPYPTFSGGAPNGFVAGPEERFAGFSTSRYVASYLRRRRWLWSFACQDAPNFGGGGVVGDHGGCDSFEWTKCRRKIINSLARSRRADGFVLVECRENETLMVKGIRVMLGVLPGGGDDRAGGDDGGGGGAGTGTGVGVGGKGERGGSRAAGEEGIGSNPGDDGGRGEGGGRSNVGGGSGGSGTQPPHGSGRGGPRAMRMILQYRVFEVSQLVVGRSY